MKIDWRTFRLVPDRSDQGWGCFKPSREPYSSALFLLLGFDESECAGKLPDASRRVGACLHLAQAPGAGHQVGQISSNMSWGYIITDIVLAPSGVEDPDPVGSDNFICLVLTPRLFKIQLFNFSVCTGAETRSFLICLLKTDLCRFDVIRCLKVLSW